MAIRRPGRLIDVERHEPLFAVLAESGFGWQAANNLDLPTQRRERGTPVGRIDWFFTRGLLASAPATIAAILPNGSPSSDHEALAVTIRLK